MGLTKCSAAMESKKKRWSMPRLPSALSKALKLVPRPKGRSSSLDNDSSSHLTAIAAARDRNAGGYRKQSLDEVALRAEISAGLSATTFRTTIEGNTSSSSVETLAATDKSTILSRLLTGRKKSLDELSIGADLEALKVGKLSKSVTLLNVCSTSPASPAVCHPSSSRSSMEEDECATIEESDEQGANEDMYSKSYGGSSSTQGMSQLLSRRMRSQDDSYEEEQEPPAPGRLSKKPTLVNLHLAIDNPLASSLTPASSSSLASCFPPSPSLLEQPRKDGTELKDRSPSLADQADGLDPSFEDLGFDAVQQLVKTPQADILQVLMLHTDSQLLRQMSEADDLSRKGSITSNHSKSRWNVPGPKSCHNSPKCSPHLRGDARGVRMRASTVGARAELRKSISRRSRLIKDDLYHKVNAAITPRRVVSGHFTFDLASRSRPGSTYLSPEPSALHTPPMETAVPEEEDALNQDTVCGKLSVDLPPAGTLSEGEAAELSPEGAVSQTPLEQKLGRLLRARGDAIAGDIPDLMPIAYELAKDVSYARFCKVLREGIGSQPGWQQVALLVNVARTAVSWVGYSTTAAMNIKTSTLHYFEDHFSNWVLGQGGWESMLGGEQVDEGL